MTCPEVIANTRSPYTGRGVPSVEIFILGKILLITITTEFLRSFHVLLSLEDLSKHLLGPPCLCLYLVFVVGLGNALEQHTKPALCCDVNED